MKSKMLATTMMRPASTKRPSASAHAASTLITTPMKVRTFGWIRSLTQVPMIARSGNMQIAPIAPVTVSRARGPRESRPFTVTEVAGTEELIMEGSDTGWNRDIVAYGHPRTQGADCPVARAARSVSVLERGRRHDLRRQGPRAAGPRAQLPGGLRQRSQDRRAPRRGRRARLHRHRLGRRGTGARE